MAPHVRQGTPDDLDGLWDLFRTSFGAPMRRRDEAMRGFDPARALLVPGPRGEVAAASHIRPFRQWFGGRPVSLAGYSPVAVLPEHRGRGLGRLVTAAQFPSLRERGEVIAGLFPATFALYRPLGFELAGSYVARRFRASDLASMGPAPLAPAHDVVVRRGGPDDVAAIERCHEAAARRRDGWVSRSGTWWERTLPRDLTETMVYVVDDDRSPGELAGYAIYRHGPARPPYDYSVVVAEVVADDPAALRALWRVVASSGTQAPYVELIGPAEDDLLLLASHAPPDAVRSEIRWMLRLVDVVGAVAARGWPGAADGQVELDVVDEHAPWNAGRWTLAMAGERAELQRGGRGTVQVTIGGLSSWWAGYATAARLQRAGQLRSVDGRALATLDAMVKAAPPVLPDFY